MPKKVTFVTDINEGAFFHEPWLTDTDKNATYRYNQIPPSAAEKLAQQMLDGYSFGKDHVELLAHYIISRKRKPNVCHSHNKSRG